MPFSARRCKSRGQDVVQTTPNDINVEREDNKTSAHRCHSNENNYSFAVQWQRSEACQTASSPDAAQSVLRSHNTELNPSQLSLFLCHMAMSVPNLYQMCVWSMHITITAR